MTHPYEAMMATETDAQRFERLRADRHLLFAGFDEEGDEAEADPEDEGPMVTVGEVMADAAHDHPELVLPLRLSGP